MFDLGMQELIVIFIVALLVLGPKKLPELGKTLGKAMGELRKAMHGVKAQMDAEMYDLKHPLELASPVAKPKEEPKDRPTEQPKEQPKEQEEKKPSALAEGQVKSDAVQEPDAHGAQKESSGLKDGQENPGRLKG